MSLLNPLVEYKIYPDIHLTENEQRITTLLTDFCAYYNAQHPADADDLCQNNNANEPLILRITGGWVRDKLLGKESHDIDIAINKLSGERFATQLNEFIATSAKYSKVLPTSSIHKIDKNPEKSKHLETTTTKLFDESIDFVNLRNEEYTNVNSRIPTIVEFGTAKQDALRRDATLNALFYNLSTMQIEDFTGLGFEDLQKGVLRTPLEPLKTFLDDPLRSLRLIRFASQFGFKVDENVLDTMKSNDIKLQLLRKVSRERIGIELGKALSASYPLVGLNLINQVQLYDVILSISEEFQDEYLNKFFAENFPRVFQNEINLIDSLYQTLSSQDPSSLGSLEKTLLKTIDPASSKTDAEKVFQRNFYLLLIFKNLIKTFPDPAYQFKIAKKKHYPVEFIIKESFRFNKVEADLVNKILTNNEFNNTIYNDPQVLTVRSLIGYNVIRSVKTADYWKLSLILNYVENFLINKESKELERYVQIYEFVESQLLGNVFAEKLIIDGKELAKIINKKPGPWLRSVNDLILQWQLDNVEFESNEAKKLACVEYIKQNEEIQKLINQ